MTNKTIGLFLLATTFLSSPAGAAALTPTLDTIKREAADLSGNFVLSELTSALPTGAVEVMIGDKSYYFMPSGENAALLATLAGTPAGSLVASENGIFELNGQKYGFDVASIPDSVFEYAENSVKDYNFIVKEADAEGFTEIAAKFRMVGAIEKTHEERYTALLNNIQNQEVFQKPERVKWQCRNCGHEYEGADAPQICPVCGHMQAFFQVKPENY